MRNIPITMATQHPDNAAAPFWESDGDGFISAKEETAELYATLKNLDCDEFMWDWEGKYVDESVVERLITDYFAYFSNHQLGRDKYLTFRIPNIWQEKGYSLARAFMSILTACDIAFDLKLKTPPLFEVILPMTTKATQLLHIQTTFTKLAKVKHRLFKDKNKNFNYIEIIPLIEGVADMFKITALLENYRKLHKKIYHHKIKYLRPFIARSDPALISGLIPAVVGSKIALSKMYQWGQKNHIKVYPILGCGSLPFRGSLAPGYLDKFIEEYRGIRTITIQSAFRYDYDLNTVKKAVKYLKKNLPNKLPLLYSAREEQNLYRIITQAKKYYFKTVLSIAPAIFKLSHFVPSRRERRLHIGLLGYSRAIGHKQFPRAINFTAVLYSLGVPPEFIGTGRALAFINQNRVYQQIFEGAYRHLKSDLLRAGRYLNKENLKLLAKSNSGWRQVQEDVDLIEKILKIKLEPKEPKDFLHRNETSNVYYLRKNKNNFSQAILEAGKLRKSLG